MAKIRDEQARNKVVVLFFFSSNHTSWSCQARCASVRLSRFSRRSFSKIKLRFLWLLSNLTLKPWVIKEEICLLAWIFLQSHHMLLSQAWMLVAICFASAVSAYVLFLITSILCQVKNLTLTCVCPASFNSLSKGCLAGEISWVEPFFFSDRKPWPSAFMYFWLGFFLQHKASCFGENGNNQKLAKVKGIILFSSPKEELIVTFFSSKPWAMFSWLLLHFFPLLMPFFTVVPGSAWSKWYSQIYLDVLSPLHVSTVVRDSPFLLTANMSKPGVLLGTSFKSAYVQVALLKLF